jgi:hypothetical protein
MTRVGMEMRTDTRIETDIRANTRMMQEEVPSIYLVEINK